MTAQTIEPCAFPEPASSPAHAPDASPPPPLSPTTSAIPTIPSWAERWLGEPGSSWAAEGQRIGLALLLSSSFGIALGLRHGGVSIPLAALGVPAGIAAVAAIAVPAFAIVLSLANAPLEALDLARATSRASMRAGLLLAGLAPGAALLLVTVEDASTVTAFGFGALLLAGIIAARSFAKALRAPLSRALMGKRAVLSLSTMAFLLFAAVLAARVWWLALPMLTEM